MKMVSLTIGFHIFRSSSRSCVPPKKQKYRISPMRDLARNTREDLQMHTCMIQAIQLPFTSRESWVQSTDSISRPASSSSHSPRSILSTRDFRKSFNNLADLPVSGSSAPRVFVLASSTLSIKAMASFSRPWRPQRAASLCMLFSVS